MSRSKAATPPKAEKKSSTDFCVKVLAYKKKLVIWPSTDKAHKAWAPTNKDRFGSVILNTEAHLRVSEEALKLLALIPPGTDAIGDFDWWACDDGTYAFSWFGGMFKIADPRQLVGARKYRTYREKATIIPNSELDAIKKELDAALNNNVLLHYGIWRPQYGLDFTVSEETLKKAKQEREKRDAARKKEEDERKAEQKKIDEGIQASIKKLQAYAAERGIKLPKTEKVK